MALSAGGPGFDPYAPPAAAGAREDEAPPLPEGVERYRLDRDAARAAARRRLLGVGAFVALALAWQCAGAPEGARAVNTTFFAVMIAAAIARRIVRHVRVLRAPDRAYELLVAGRVLRRNVAGVAPAEVVMGGDVTVTEGRHGLSVIAGRGGHRRHLLVPRMLAGYDGVRERLTAAAPIRQAGWLAWRARLAGAFGRERLVDADDPALADGELAAALAAARAASSRLGAGVRPAGLGGCLVRAFLVWLLLVVAFLAIWQALAPRTIERAPPGRPVRSD